MPAGACQFAHSAPPSRSGGGVLVALGCGMAGSATTGAVDVPNNSATVLSSPKAALTPTVPTSAKTAMPTTGDRLAPRRGLDEACDGKAHAGQRDRGPDADPDDQLDAERVGRIRDLVQPRCRPRHRSRGPPRLESASHGLSGRMSRAAASAIAIASRTTTATPPNSGMLRKPRARCERWAPPHGVPARYSASDAPPRTASGTTTARACGQTGRCRSRVAGPSGRAIAVGEGRSVIGRTLGVGCRSWRCAVAVLDIQVRRSEQQKIREYEKPILFCSVGCVTPRLSMNYSHRSFARGNAPIGAPCQVRFPEFSTPAAVRSAPHG